MRRGSFLKALVALPFAPKAAAALVQAPEAPDVLEVASEVEEIPMWSVVDFEGSEWSTVSVTTSTGSTSSCELTVRWQKPDGSWTEWEPITSGGFHPVQGRTMGFRYGG